MKPLKILFFILLIILVSFTKSLKTPEQKNSVAIGFWNVENLYDTINDPLKEDDEFTPAGSNKWTDERYRKKLSI